MKLHVFSSSSQTPEDQVPISGVAISEDGDKLAVVNENGNLYVWLSKSSETASAGFVPFGRVRAVHHPYATKCLFSPNSQYSVTASKACHSPVAVDCSSRLDRTE